MSVVPSISTVLIRIPADFLVPISSVYIFPPSARSEVLVHCRMQSVIYLNLLILVSNCMNKSDGMKFSVNKIETFLCLLEEIFS